MKLRPKPFAQIAAGQKDLELRLWDQKRQQLRPGDTIRFCCEEQTLCTRVVALHRFADFQQLLRTFPPRRCGITHPREMEAYYSAAEQAQYGVVAIELELI